MRLIRKGEFMRSGDDITKETFHATEKKLLELILEVLLDLRDMKAFEQHRIPP